MDLDADQPVADLPISRTRLTEILAGQRTDDHVSKEEKQRRQNEAKILLQKVFGVSSLTEGLLCLYDDPAKFVVEILRIDELRKLLTEQLKDALFPTPGDLLKQQVTVFGSYESYAKTLMMKLESLTLRVAMDQQ